MPKRRPTTGAEDLERDQQPAFLDLDLRSAAGQRLLASTAERYGPAIADGATVIDRPFLIRSPWAPGLRFVGGRAVHAGGADAPCDRQEFSLGGTGETLEDALARCIGEGIELLSQPERRGDVTCRATVAQAAARLLPGSGALIAGQIQGGDRAADQPIDWIEARSAITGTTCLVPADWCIRRRAERMGLAVPWLLGTGTAAGPDYDTAALRAVLELIERDAVALWWAGGRRGRALPLEAPALTEALRTLSALRLEITVRRSWLLDIATDLGVPCVACLTTDRDGRGLVCGMAARLTYAAAAEAAAREACQMETSLLLARSRHVHGGDAALSEHDRGTLLRAGSLETASCDLLHPLGLSDARDLGPGTTVAQLASLLDGAGIAIGLVDLSRPGYDLRVVRAVSNGLQHFPGRDVSRRLALAIAETGGGAPFATGISPF